MNQIIAVALGGARLSLRNVSRQRDRFVTESLMLPHHRHFRIQSGHFGRFYRRIYNLFHIFAGNFLPDRAGQFNQSDVEYSHQCYGLHTCYLDRFAVRQGLVLFFGRRYPMVWRRHSLCVDDN